MAKSFEQWLKTKEASNVLDTSILKSETDVKYLHNRLLKSYNCGQESYDIDVRLPIKKWMQDLSQRASNGKRYLTNYDISMLTQLLEYKTP